MPDDVDKTLARLAVDHGFITKDEALRYWQQIQAPGSPRFVAVLLSSGRLSRADVDRLRAIYQQQSPGAASGGVPQATPQNGPALAMAAPPVAAAAGRGGLPQTLPPRPSAPIPIPAAAPGEGPAWEEALQQDAQLARALFQRGAVTQDRLRECRQLQLQHRMRLGAVLAKKGYADPALVDEAMQSLGLAPAPAPVAAPPANPFQMSPSAIDQDAMPTLNMPPGMPMMGVPPGGPMGVMTPSGPRFGPQDAIPTIMGGVSEASIEELNPFAQGSPAPPGLGGRVTGKKKIDMMTSPIGAEGMLSGDELNAFQDIPLAPPPSRESPPLATPAAPPQNGGMFDQPADDATIPPAWAQQLAPEAPPSGANPAIETPDSGGERPAAKKKTTAMKKAAAPSGGGGGKGLLIIILLVGLGLLGVVALVLLKFVFKVF